MEPNIYHNIDALQLQKEIRQFTRTHPEFRALELTGSEWSILQQVVDVKPFRDHTNSVS